MNERITVIEKGEEMPTPEKSLERINEILTELEKPGAEPTIEQLAGAEAEINRHWKFLDHPTQTELEVRVAKALRRKQ